jgi:FkbM family methyltransferase
MEILNKNIKLNKLNDDNVIAINYAVHSKETKIKLYTPEEKSGHTIYNTIVPGRIRSEKFIEVNANTLDRLVEETGVKHEDVNWIKIDVEGAEFEVLKGAHNILSKSKDIALLIEVHNIAEGQNLYENIIALLKTYNFKIDFEKIHEGGERHVIMRKI